MPDIEPLKGLSDTSEDYEDSSPRSRTGGYWPERVIMFIVFLFLLLARCMGA